MKLFRIFTTYWRVRRKVKELMIERTKLDAEKIKLLIEHKGDTREYGKLWVKDMDLRDDINLLTEILK